MHRNDVAAVAILVAHVRESSPESILYYFEQQTDSEGKITQHFRLAVTCPFGLRMLARFGNPLAFMDAVYGINNVGFAQISIVIRDEYGNAALVAAAIVDAEPHEVYVELLEKLQEVSSSCCVLFLLWCSHCSVR